MKRCPQCEFIYEDDQSLCDMDGVLLVLDSRTLPHLHALATVEVPVATQSSLAAPDVSGNGRADSRDCFIARLFRLNVNAACSRQRRRLALRSRRRISNLPLPLIPFRRKQPT